MMQRASGRAFGDSESSSSSSSGSVRGNEDAGDVSPPRSRSPSIIVRTGVSVHRHKRRDLPWGVRLIQKFTDWWYPNRTFNRDF
jgi:hypothetical protein